MARYKVTRGRKEEVKREADEERFREEQDADRGNRLVLPEDGHQWKKYGQKFIKKIHKFRSYFKCQTMNCRAKKRVEWSTSEPAGNVRVVYEGVHNHGFSAPDSGSSHGTSNSSANQYNLLTQVFGNKPTFD
nr:WRKY [Loropetalum chinense var. rubrum]